MEAKRSIGIKLLLLSGLIFTISPCFAKGIPEHPRAQIGFGSTINDAGIVKFLKRHPVSVKSVMLWSHGIGGSFNTFVESNPAQFIKDARAHFIDSITKGWEFRRMMIDRFLNAHTEEETSTDEALQIEARSILCIVKNCESMLATLKSNKPVFFGIEVEADNHILEDMCKEPIVRGYILSEDIKALNNTRNRNNTIKPEVYQNEYEDSSVLTASPRDLYQLLLKDLKKLENRITKIITNTNNE